MIYLENWLSARNPRKQGGPTFASQERESIPKAPHPALRATLSKREGKIHRVTNQYSIKTPLSFGEGQTRPPLLWPGRGEVPRGKTHSRLSIQKKLS